MAFNTEIRDKILQATDIVELIGDALDIRKRGANYLALCPFHNEKTPSFSISPERQIYKCFGCGVSGNAITFMMEYFRMSYPDTLKELARKAGIVYEEREYSPEEKAKFDEQDSIKKVLTSAEGYYKRLLQTTSGKTALSYLRKRGFSDKLIEKFSLGYSPDAWDGLIKQMLKENFDKKTLELAGLVISKDSGEPYDRFRNRLMFPIHDHFGQVVGFGARLLEDVKAQAKYINSPQTRVYDKSKILYGLYFAKDEIRKKGVALMTEGYADVLALHQAGFKNAVASSGTSLTKQQLLNLYRYCKKIHIIYDADSAGIKAAQRGLEIALEHGFEVMIVRLPKGEDPDSIIRKLGENSFQSYIDDAVPFIDFVIEKTKEDGELNTPKGRADTIRMLMEIITKIPDKLQHDEYIKSLSTKMNLSDEQVKQIYREKRILERKNSSSSKTEVDFVFDRKAQQQTLTDDKSSNDFVSTEEMLPAEILLLTIAVSEAGVMKRMSEDFSLTIDRFVTESGRKLLSHVIRLSEINDDLMIALFDDTKISEAEKKILTDLVFNDKKSSDNWDNFSNRQIEIDYDTMITQAIVKLDLKRIEEERNSISAKMKTLTEEEQLEIMKELVELSKKRIELEKLLIN